jgi:hypothetical protein
VLAVRYPLEIKELLIAAAPDIFFDAVFSFPSEQQTRRCCFLDNLCFLPQTDVWGKALSSIIGRPHNGCTGYFSFKEAGVIARGEGTLKNSRSSQFAFAPASMAAPQWHELCSQLPDHGRSIFRGG